MKPGILNIMIAAVAMTVIVGCGNNNDKTSDGKSLTESERRQVVIKELGIDNATLGEFEFDSGLIATPTAGTTLQCSDTNMQYKVSTGNGKGRCDIIMVDDGQTGSKPSHALCRDGSGNTSKASCKTGCGSSEGSGDCDGKKMQ
ncbi:MAG: hypothetical protein AAGB02_01500 [Pseudomonadota bacterium]